MPGHDIQLLARGQCALLQAGQRWNQLAAQRVRLRSRERVAGFLADARALLIPPGPRSQASWSADSKSRTARSQGLD